jgi:virginiamycin A acetyltransferase
VSEKGRSPESRYPIPDVARTGFLRPFITRPNIVVGDYTYYDDPRGLEHFEENVLHHFDFIGHRLLIGRYCSIAADVIDRNVDRSVSEHYRSNSGLSRARCAQGC